MNTKTDIRRLRLGVAVFATAALLVSSCGSSDSGNDAGGVATASDSGSDSEEGTSNDESDVRSAEDDSSAGNDAEAGTGDTGGDCLVGSWIISESELQGFYDAILQDNAQLPMTFAVNGDVGLDLNSDGSLVYTPDLTLVIEAGGIEGSGELIGTLSGSYSAEDSVITTEITEDDTELTITLSGVTMTDQDLGGAFSGLPIANAEYSCEDGHPVLQFDTSTRHVPVALEPR